MIRDRDRVSRRRCDAEEVIITLASRQHGVVARTQLVQAGVPGDVIDRRLKKSWLRAIHRGVYLVGGRAAPRALEMAAVLACGGDAVVSHWSAAELWELVPARGDSALVEVSARRGDPSGRPNIRVHRARSLRPDEVTERTAIPVTTAARTLYDLTGAVNRRELERAVAAAFSRGLTNRAELVALLTRHARRPGTMRLRALVEAEAQPTLTQSEAEERFLALIGKGELPAPAVNVTIGGHRVDFYWPVQRFVVEIDGFMFHSSARMFESDRRRDSVLAAAGIRVMRATWRQLVSEPEALLVRLAQALARSGDG